MNGHPKSIRALVLAASHCAHPELDGVDKALLSYLAQYAKPDGTNSHPPGTATSVTRSGSRTEQPTNGSRTVFSGGCFNEHSGRMGEAMPVPIGFVSKAGTTRIARLAGNG